MTRDGLTVTLYIDSSSLQDIKLFYNILMFPAVYLLDVVHQIDSYKNRLWGFVCLAF